MKCVDCTEYYIPEGVNYPDYCNPDSKDDKEDSCENFSILCCICNEGYVDTENKCCLDLRNAREEDHFPCPGKPDGVTCLQGDHCPGIDHRKK